MIQINFYLIYSIYTFLQYFAFTQGVNAQSVRPFIKGVSPQDLSKLVYDSVQFTCRDGSKIIPFNRVNDDFCDCKDGSDEPGTPACPNGKYYCENKPHVGKTIFSSALYDGICDCCDGSDEKEGVCSNTCKDFAEMALKGRREQVANYRKGVRVRKQYVTEAKDELEKKKQELEEKKQQLDQIKKERDTLKALETELNQKKTKKIEELKAKAREAQAQQDAAEAPPQEEQPQQTGEQSREENQVETENKQENEEEQQLKEAVEETPEEIIEEPPIEEEEEEEDIKYEEDEELKSINEDAIPPAIALPWSYILRFTQYVYKVVFGGINYVSKSKISDLTKLTNNIKELDDKVRNLEKDVNSLTQMFELDFGPNKEFFHLYGKCFNAETVEYTYELCPFDKVNQKSKTGGSSTSLGTWNKNQANWSKDFKIMEYTNGVRCWGGPDRSMKVELLCAADNKAEDPQEPAKCEYSMKLYTPAACKEDVAIAMHHELALFEAQFGGTHVHDEL